MRKYIQNLTDNLIGKNQYDEILRRMGNEGKFLQHVKTDLCCGDVRDMNPDTLGKIMCSFESGDIVADKDDLFNGVHFGGDCAEMLRELVALCLAYVILDRLRVWNYGVSLGDVHKPWRHSRAVAQHRRYNLKS